MAGTGKPGIFYKLSAGLTATKLNLALRIIGKNTENKTGENPKYHYVDSFGDPKHFFFAFGGLKEISEVTRGELQKK